MKQKKRPAADLISDPRSEGPLLAETESNSGHTYRVYIPSTPKWKIEAIARYKVQQNRKRKYFSTSSSVTSAYSPQNKSTPRDSPPLTSIKADQVKLEEIHYKCYEIAKEVNALNSVRHSLIWLLKKATLYETNLNHS